MSLIRNHVAVLQAWACLALVLVYATLSITWPLNSRYAFSCLSTKNCLIQVKCYIRLSI